MRNTDFSQKRLGLRPSSEAYWTHDLGNGPCFSEPQVFTPNGKKHPRPVGLLLALSSHVYAPQCAEADTLDVFSSWQLLLFETGFKKLRQINA